MGRKSLTRIIILLVVNIIFIYAAPDISRVTVRYDLGQIVLMLYFIYPAFSLIIGIAGYILTQKLWTAVLTNLLSFAVVLVQGHGLPRESAFIPYLLAYLLICFVGALMAYGVKRLLYRNKM